MSTQEAKGLILDSIRAKRRKLADTQTTDIPVAGYGGELVIRYRLLDPLVEGKELGERLTSQFNGNDQESERLYYALVDSLIAACVSVYAVVNGSLVPLGGEGTLTTFEDTTELADLLGFDEPATARETVAAVFGGNRIAVSAHATQLQKWMMDPTGELNARTLG